jgi:hypothetical protein
VKYAVEIASSDMVYVPSLMYIGTGVQALLTFCLSNLRYCNVGITEERDL